MCTVSYRRNPFLTRRNHRVTVLVLSSRPKSSSLVCE